MRMQTEQDSASMACNQNSSTCSCDKPCRGKCNQGEVHIPYQERCGRPLPCGHSCEAASPAAACSLSCPPCHQKCEKQCFHSRCPELCCDPCTPCVEPCSWQCEHHKCEKSCHEICTRPRCNLPCPKVIPRCGHPCIGLCGEVCPQKCRVCHPKTLDIITQVTLEDYDEFDRFVELQECGHIFEVSALDTWMSATSEATQPDGSVAVSLKECPECRASIWRTYRYSNEVKKKHLQLETVKERVLSHELSKGGYLLLEQGDHKGALAAFHQMRKRNPHMVEAHLGIARALIVRKEYDKAIRHLSLIVERSSFAVSLAKYTQSAQQLCRVSGPTVADHFHKSPRRASKWIAIQAVLQWASALTEKREFTTAVEFCDKVLAKDPQNLLAEQIKKKACKGEVQLVIRAMAKELGGRGHWFTCPNGHYYTIGECAFAMQASKCPDCRADVGGDSHYLRFGNMSSRVDRSAISVWESIRIEIQWSITALWLFCCYNGCA